MHLNSRSRRVWVIFAGLWLLFALVLAAPFSEAIPSEYDAVSWLSSFIFLCLSPFISPLNDWATKTISYRWVHLLLATALIFCLIFLVFEAEWGSDVAVRRILLLWWLVFVISFVLTGSAITIRFGFPSNETFAVCIVGILTAALAIMLGVFLGLLFDVGVGPSLGILTALTFWVLAWYQIRRNKRQFYRWRNFLFTLVSANWIGVAAVTVFGDSALFIGPSALIVGIFLYVFPKPNELQNGMQPGSK